MSAARASRVRGELRIVTLWTCRQCKRTEEGSIITVEVFGDGLDSQAAEAARRAGRHTIPVGWLSFGAQGVSCPECYKEGS